MKKVAVATTTRADYGILRPLILRLRKDGRVRLQLIVSGTHLSPEHGYTKSEIEADGVDIFAEIPIFDGGDTPYDVSIAMAKAICGFAAYFREERPDLLIVLGDRTEILAVCCAAMNERIAIAHLHGGELTEGAVDDCVRHAVTKMSYLHFAAAEEYRDRIIRMGEQPDRVFNVGALGVENVLRTPLLSYEEACAAIGIRTGQEYVVATFHPETLKDCPAREQVLPLIGAMRSQRQYFYLITKANADAGGSEINRMMEDFAAECSNVRLVSSLGMVRYLSAVKYSAFVLGNSSSGVIEAPALGVPCVNIGGRQRGRLMADTVVSCPADESSIVDAMNRAAHIERKPSYIYGDGNTSGRIADILYGFLDNGKVDLRKKFYDGSRAGV